MEMQFLLMIKQVVRTVTIRVYMIKVYKNYTCFNIDRHYVNN
jgi:hypothetical protein